ISKEIPVPKQKVVNSAHQTAASHKVISGGPVDQEFAVLAWIVGGNAIRDDQLVVIKEERVVHPERLKDVFGCELRKRLLGRALDHFGEEKIICIAVVPLRAGNIVQSFLPADELENIA